MNENEYKLLYEAEKLERHAHHANSTALLAFNEKLIAERAMLQAEVISADQSSIEHFQNEKKLMAERDALKAENEKMREALEKIHRKSLSSQEFRLEAGLFDVLAEIAYDARFALKK